jgi:starch synthase
MGEIHDTENWRFPLRVGLMSREYPPDVYGGAGVHVEYLSRELAKKIEVEVHCWGNQNIDRGNLHVRGSCPWSAITEGTQEKFKTALETLSLNLAQMVMLEKIDIVHTHTWYVSMAGFLAKTLFDVPFVLTTHSLEPLRAWKAEQLGSGYRMSSWIERTAIHDADAIVAVSNGTKEDILKAYPEVNPSRIHVIYNGIDLDQYQKVPENDALVKYGVDPTRQKGVTHLVDAIAYMPKNIQIVLCAGAPDTPEIATEMRQKVDDIKTVNPHVVWIEKMVSKADAIQFYSNCRVFCCPSIYEPFGIINLEAMACRAPVVASATGGILEVVVDNETGYLIPFDQDPVTRSPSNPEKFSRDLAGRITQLMDDPEKARKMGEAGRRRVEEKFAWSAIADQTIALYQRLIDEYGRQRRS